MFLEVLKRLFLGLVSLLSNQFGDDDDKDEDTGDKDEDKGEDEESGDADDDSGKDVGKDRSKYIPRERFDKVNVKASKLDKLIELGIVAEDEDGEIRINPKLLEKPKDKDKEADAEDVSNFMFSQNEVDDKSWPLVEKINKGFNYFKKTIDTISVKAAFSIAQLQSENAILRDYPEFIQKDSPLKKKALDIMKNDPEFKKTYRGNPEAGYWAVKRAAEFLAGKQPEKSKDKPKSSFIVGRGDAGRTGVKKVDLTKLSKDELDKLEKQEHERLQNLHKTRK
jgi:hypothetical protein